MDGLLEDLENSSFEEKSRSSRWKNTQSYLKQFMRIADENSDYLANVEHEIKQIRECNLNLAGLIQILADLAGEEAQREISLTLNDMESDIVVDAIPQDFIQPQYPVMLQKAVPSPENAVVQEPAMLYEPMRYGCNAENVSMELLVEELPKVPGIGEKKAQAIVEHLAGCIEARCIGDSDTTEQTMLDFGEVEGGYHEQ